ncbi:MAG TPA: hypothetical protein DGT21_21280 [Armatimonadetes bacterium]|nr:hypothetical protein [Armatimonadota bacterium]
MHARETISNTEHERSPRIYVSVISLSVCGSLTMLYLLRPPNVDPITIWPYWFWSLPAIVLSAFAVSSRNRFWGMMTVGAWFFATLVVAEEPAALARMLTQSPPPISARRPPDSMRIVTLNCAGGDVRAAAESFIWDADIVLLQEAPAAAELDALVATRDGWQSSCALDPAILARGSIAPVPVGQEQAAFVCAADITLPHIPSMPPVRVISTRLLLPSLRTRVWLPEVWSDGFEARADREEQMKAVAGFAREGLGTMPVIVGGDFNAPAGDSLFRVLQPEFRDAYPEGGAGWPNTITNDTPMSRIDQVWVSRQFEVESAWVVRTQHSDHRAVVVDLRLVRGH